MKTRLIIILLAILFITPSCSDKGNEDSLNREADIESFTFPSDIQVNITIIDDKIVAVVRNADMTSLAPKIKVSEGATVVPASGVAQDFTKEVKYTVTSEDKNYKKIYSVNVTLLTDTIPVTDSVIRFIYDFENWWEAGASWKYPALSDIMWQSANLGIATAKTGKVEKYPTRSTDDAYSGSSAALLETLEGGKFWGKDIPIFSGSLFRGDFKLDMQNVLNSTRFGQIHPKESGKPKTFSGYYKYTPGETFTGGIDGQVDEFSIFAVVFKVTKGEAGLGEFLNGSNVQTSEKVVATAILEDRTQKENYTHFSIPFTYKEELDYSLHDYKLAIVLASSKEGDSYKGAVGSKLIVDDITLECTPIK